MNYINIYSSLRNTLEDLLLTFHMTDMDEVTYNSQRKRLKEVLKKVEKKLPGTKTSRVRRAAKHGLTLQEHNDLLREEREFVTKQRMSTYISSQKEKAQRLIQEGKKFIAVDVECGYDVLHTLFEIGFTTFQKGVIKSYHYSFNRRRGFKFGTTAYTSVEEGIAALKTEMETSDVLIGHELRADVKYLAKYMTLYLPVCFDTAKMSRRGPNNNKLSLKNLCSALNIVTDGLHNGGNDARYTMEAFLAFISS